IIQSSQPSSLKFTCRGFLLQRVLAFFPWPLPPDRAAMVVLLFLRLGNASWPGSGGSRKGGLLRALILSRISLKRFSFLWVREKATSRARSWGCGWGLPKPSCRGGRSCPERSETILTSQTSNTSHLEEPVSKMSAALESSSWGSSPSRLGQVPRRRWWKVPSGDRAKLRFSGRERRIRSSAPVTSSASGRLEMSKRYRSSEVQGTQSEISLCSTAPRAPQQVTACVSCIQECHSGWGHQNKRGGEGTNGARNQFKQVAPSSALFPTS
uniref:Uncharacterized protein n=1 Tax=Malurus cyaneus samueli TaxID=2593467 RepID=A0A8C5T8I5_9PASS